MPILLRIIYPYVMWSACLQLPTHSAWLQAAIH
jgi:hypothetical protein